MKRIYTVCFLCACMLIISLSACQQKSPHTTPPDEWITPVETINLDGMNLFWRCDNLQFGADDSATLSIYVAAEKDDNGAFAFDDGQDWAVIVETSLGDYPLFSRRYVQIGGVSCVVYIEYADEDTIFHVVVTVEQTAGYRLYDCVFDNARNAFKIIPIYEANGINFIADSKNFLSTENNRSHSSGLSLNVNYATDELLSEYGSSIDEYIEFDDDGYPKIIFTTASAIRNFRFIEIGNTVEGDEIVFYEKAVLYSLDELSPEKPFVVTWMEQGAIPHRGISFADENGETRYFCIAASGEDGSLFLVEFE